jgi:hypothetical protein
MNAEELEMYKRLLEICKGHDIVFSLTYDGNGEWWSSVESVCGLNFTSKSFNEPKYPLKLVAHYLEVEFKKRLENLLK